MKKKKENNLSKDYNLFKIDYPYRGIYWYHNFELMWQNIKGAFERMKYGISEYDAWNVNGYLYLILENSLRILVRDAISHPIGTTIEDWRKELQTIIEQVVYLRSDIDEEPEVKAAYKTFRKDSNDSTRDAWYKALDEADARRKIAKKAVFEWLIDRIEELWW